jgi:hypothetical protein
MLSRPEIIFSVLYGADVGVGASAAAAKAVCKANVKKEMNNMCLSLVDDTAQL